MAKVIMIRELTQIVASYLRYYRDVKSLKHACKATYALTYDITIKDNSGGYNMMIYMMKKNDYIYNITGLILQNKILINSISMLDQLRDEITYLEIDVDKANLDIELEIKNLKTINIIGKKIEVCNIMRYGQIFGNDVFQLIKNIPNKYKIISDNNNEIIKIARFEKRIDELHSRIFNEMFSEYDYCRHEYRYSNGSWYWDMNDGDDDNIYSINLDTHKPYVHSPIKTDISELFKHLLV